jgi:hypothetical protein
MMRPFERMQRSQNSTQGRYILVGPRAAINQRRPEIH